MKALAIYLAVTAYCLQACLPEKPLPNDRRANVEVLQEKIDSDLKSLNSYLMHNGLSRKKLPIIHAYITSVEQDFLKAQVAGASKQLKLLQTVSKDVDDIFHQLRQAVEEIKKNGRRSKNVQGPTNPAPAVQAPSINKKKAARHRQGGTFRDETRLDDKHADYLFEVIQAIHNWVEKAYKDYPKTSALVKSVYLGIEDVGSLRRIVDYFHSLGATISGDGVELGDNGTGIKAFEETLNQFINEASGIYQIYDIDLKDEFNLSQSSLEA